MWLTTELLMRREGGIEGFSPGRGEFGFHGDQVANRILEPEYDGDTSLIVVVEVIRGVVVIVGVF
jgi:hypothetical protein